MVVQIIKHFHSEEAHCEWLLADGRSDRSFLDPFKRSRRSVHSDYELVSNVLALENVGDLRGGSRLETNEGVNLTSAVLQYLFRHIESDACLPLCVDHPNCLKPRI